MAKKWQNMNELCDLVRETSFAIHRYHRSGHLEKIYENALAHRLRKAGLEVKQQHSLVCMTRTARSWANSSRTSSLRTV